MWQSGLRFYRFLWLLRGPGEAMGLKGGGDGDRGSAEHWGCR